MTLVTNAIGLAEGHWSHERHGKRSEKHEDWHWLVLGGLRVVGVEIALPPSICTCSDFLSCRRGIHGFPISSSEAPTVRICCVLAQESVLNSHPPDQCRSARSVFVLRLARLSNAARKAQHQVFRKLVSILEMCLFLRVYFGNIFSERSRRSLVTGPFGMGPLYFPRVLRQGVRCCSPVLLRRSVRFRSHWARCTGLLWIRSSHALLRDFAGTEGIDNFVGWDTSQLAALDSRSPITTVCSTWPASRLSVSSLFLAALPTRSRSPSRLETPLVLSGPRGSKDGNGVWLRQLPCVEGPDTSVRYSVLRGLLLRPLLSVLLMYPP